MPPAELSTTFRFIGRRDGVPYERGRERVLYRHHADGHLSLHASSENAERGVVREALCTVTAAGRPHDAYTRIHLDGAYEGSGWFRFGADFAEAECFNVKTGRSSQRLALSGAVCGFGAHPVSTDLLLCGGYDRGVGGVQRPPNVFLSSPDHFGRTGPLLAPVVLDVEYVGRETIDTPAGRLDADHWRFPGDDGSAGHGHPTEDLWALADTFVLLHAEVGGGIGTTYQLTALEGL